MRGVTFLPKLIHIPAGADRVMRGDRWRGEGEPLPPREEEEAEEEAEEEEGGMKCQSLGVSRGDGGDCRGLWNPPGLQPGEQTLVRHVRGWRVPEGLGSDGTRVFPTAPSVSPTGPSVSPKGLSVSQQDQVCH